MFSCYSVYVEIIILEEQIRVFLNYSEILGNRWFAYTSNMESVLLDRFVKETKERNERIQATRAICEKKKEEKENENR
jgi:hypothetical protein